jgi:hypothetical protein
VNSFPCPGCLKPLPQDWQALPGDYFVCKACGQFITINNEFAAVPANPDEVTSVSSLRLKVLLKWQIQRLEKICGRVPVESQSKLTTNEERKVT